MLMTTVPQIETLRTTDHHWPDRLRIYGLGILLSESRRAVYRDGEQERHASQVLRRGSLSRLPRPCTITVVMRRLHSRPGYL
jgi:hypothetical protein